MSSPSHIVAAEDVGRDEAMPKDIMEYTGSTDLE